MSLETHHLTMGNSIMGSRRITDTNSGPVTFNRPAQTHSSIIAVPLPVVDMRRRPSPGRFREPETGSWEGFRELGNGIREGFREVGTRV
jgi:hypothetical protein